MIAPTLTLVFIENAEMSQSDCYNSYKLEGGDDYSALSIAYCTVRGI